MSDSSNIDNRLGVRNLAVPSKANLSSQSSKPKVIIEHWSANNGSVIYAQSGGSLRNGSIPLCRNLVNNSEGDQTQQKHTTNVKVYSMHLNAMNAEKVQQNHPNSTIKETKTALDTTTSGVFKTAQVNKIPTQIEGLQTNAIVELRQDDLSQINTSKWSNGTSTTSDLLF